MNQSITITLNKQETQRLNHMALRYGLSLPEFSRKVLTQLNQLFPSESFADYRNPTGLKKSFNRAILDWRAGRVFNKL